MNLDAARHAISLALHRADEALGRTTFDEWMIVSLVGLGRDVLHYSGPRPETALAQFAEDLRPLARELLERHHRVGNVNFVPDGEGPAFDALISLGAGLYAILNDTRGSTSDLQKLPDWPAAEQHLVTLGDRFLKDPLSL